MLKDINIADFGAKEGILSTDCIQKAFDRANEIGGATVVIPAGFFLTGTINIGNASIRLEKGAVLKGSPNPEDYCDNGFVHNEMKKCISLLYSLNNDNFSITGEGTIDLNGGAFYNFDKREIPGYCPELSQEQMFECTATYSFRPTQPMFFYNCNNIRIEGIKIRNAPCWTMSFNDCENIHIRNLAIDNDPVIPNNDGMHFCGCRRVFIHGCNIISGDDCIALSSITDWDKPCEDFVISDCVLCSSSKAIVLGYMHSIVRNVCITNCIIRDSHRGLCIMASCETGLVEHILVENLRVDTRVRAGNWWGNGEPICIFSLYHHSTYYLNPAPSRHWKINIKDVQLRNISCSGENIIGIVGTEGNIQDVSVDGIYYERKRSKNSYLKGVNTIDVSPAVEKIAVPGEDMAYWIHIQGCRNIKIKNANIENFQETELKASILKCENVQIN